MGLILSVLVACVGVYKFLRIYCEIGNDGDRKLEINHQSADTEDVRIECKSEILARNRRFLVTETRTSSPERRIRKFQITKDDGQCSDLREFVITKGVKKDDPTSKKFVLIDTNDNYKEVSPLPLPKQFLITQTKTLNSSINQAIGINLNDDKKLDVQTVNVPLEVFHRDPSPYPTDPPIRTFNSEFLSVVEIDEDQYNKSNKIDIILETHNNITAYTTNKILVVPPELLKREKQRSKSACRNEDKVVSVELRRVSSCSKIQDCTEPTSIFINLLKNGRNEEFRRSLDGVKRASESRRSFKKRKNRSQNSLGN